MNYLVAVRETTTQVYPVIIPAADEAELLTKIAEHYAEAGENVKYELMAAYPVDTGEPVNVTTTTA